MKTNGDKSFSVLTVTKRTGWENIAIESIERQTARPDKWVVVTEEPLSIESALVVPAPPRTKPSNLSASNNEGLRHIDTDYVIFYQDFIELQEDCFEKLLSLADEKTFVGTCTPNYDGSDDGRYTGADLPRPCRPEEWEANVALAPMGILRELGGFDEEYDWGFAWDNVNISQRAAMLGCRFILDESNRPKLYPHEQEDKKNLTPNGEYHERVMREIRDGERPLKLPYL